MLSRGPSRGGCPSVYDSETLTAFEPPRQQPPAAACPSLSKEGSATFILGRPAACAALLKIPSLGGVARRAGVGFPFPPEVRLVRRRTPFSSHVALQRVSHFMPSGAPQEHGCLQCKRPLLMPAQVAITNRAYHNTSGSSLAPHRSQHAFRRDRATFPAFGGKINTIGIVGGARTRSSHASVLRNVGATLRAAMLDAEAYLAAEDAGR